MKASVQHQMKEMKKAAAVKVSGESLVSSVASISR